MKTLHKTNKKELTKQSANLYKMKNFENKKKKKEMNE